LVRILILVAFLSVVLTGCVSPELQVEEANPIEAVPINNELKDYIRVDPGSYYIGSDDGVLDKRYFAGKLVEAPLSISNYYSVPRTISIHYTVPTDVGEGYSFPPVNAVDWVTFPTPEIEVPPNSISKIMVVLEMPEGEESPPFWEFWTTVKDMSQSGMVQIEYNIRWRVEMKD